MVKYAEQASVEDISADDYVRRLEALDAQRVVEAREAERRDREERELEQKLRAAGRRFAEIDAREEELFIPDAEDALAMDRAAAQDAIQACLDAQRRAEVLTSVPEESPEAWSSPSPEPAPSATALAEDAPSATVLAEDLAPAADGAAAEAADGVSAEQAAEDSEMAPAASATALAEDLAPAADDVPAAQAEAADGVTAAQAAEDRRPSNSPNKAAAPAAAAAPAGRRQ